MQTDIYSQQLACTLQGQQHANRYLQSATCLHLAGSATCKQISTVSNLLAPCRVSNMQTDIYSQQLACTLQGQQHANRNLQSATCLHLAGSATCKQKSTVSNLLAPCRVSNMQTEIYSQQLACTLQGQQHANRYLQSATCLHLAGSATCKQISTVSNLLAPCRVSNMQTDIYSQQLACTLQGQQHANRNLQSATCLHLAGSATCKQKSTVSNLLAPCRVSNMQTDIYSQQLACTLQGQQHANRNLQSATCLHLAGSATCKQISTVSNLLAPCRVSNMQTEIYSQQLACTLQGQQHANRNLQSATCLHLAGSATCKQISTVSNLLAPCRVSNMQTEIYSQQLACTLQGQQHANRYLQSATCLHLAGSATCKQISTVSNLLAPCRVSNMQTEIYSQQLACTLQGQQHANRYLQSATCLHLAGSATCKQISTVSNLLAPCRVSNMQTDIYSKQLACTLQGQQHANRYLQQATCCERDLGNASSFKPVLTFLNSANVAFIYIMTYCQAYLKKIDVRCHWPTWVTLKYTLTADNRHTHLK